MKTFKRIMCIILSCMLLITGSAFDVFASGIIDPTKPVSLSITYKYEDTVIPDTGFDIYYIASVDADLKFTLTEPFKEYPLPSDPSVSQSDWNNYADTLKAYVQSKGIAPDYHKVTDSEGKWSLAGLGSGMYFYFGEKRSMDGYTYINQAGLISLPNLEKVVLPDGKINYRVVYDVTISPKVSRSKNPTPHPGGTGGGGGESTVMKKAIIKWMNDDKDNRPESISAHLLKDGVLYETVLLTPGGDWRYTWFNLPKYDDKGHKIEWTVSIDPPEGYTYTIQIEGITTVFILSGEEEALKPKDPRLPQTGLLWWPVPVLLSLGVLLVIIGILRRRSDEA